VRWGATLAPHRYISLFKCHEEGCTLLTVYVFLLCYSDVVMSLSHSKMSINTRFRGHLLFVTTPSKTIQGEYYFVYNINNNIYNIYLQDPGTCSLRYQLPVTFPARVTCGIPTFAVAATGGTLLAFLLYWLDQDRQHVGVIEEETATSSSALELLLLRLPNLFHQRLPLLGSVRIRINDWCPIVLRVRVLLPGESSVFHPNHGSKVKLSPPLPPTWLAL